MPSALAFAAQRFTAEEIDRVLIGGANESTSRLHILTEYQKDKSTAEIAATLPTAFVGGKGFETIQGKVCAWYGEDGIHLTRGTAARYVVSAQVIPWEAAAERIGELLEQGQYATYEELALAPAFERKELSHSLWYLRQDLDEKGADYLTTIKQLYTGKSFDEATKEIAALMEQPESRRALTEEVRAFAQAYEQDRSLLRFHFHKPLNILKRMEELELPRQEFESVIPEIPKEQSFITQDEIDGTLVSRYAYSEGNVRIHAFFQSNHTQAEKVTFIKNHYGIGGCSHALFGASGSWMDYDGKGLRLRKEGCEDVSLQWNTVAKRIDDLIAHGRYLSKEDLQRINVERTAEPTVAIPRQETSSSDAPDELDAYIPIDTEKVRQGLAARGIAGGNVVDSTKLAQDPFIQAVEEDVERISAESDAPSYERFSVIETDNGYGIWDDLHDDYYSDDDGVTEEFASEWQAESYLGEVRKAVEAKEIAHWNYIEHAKFEPLDAQPTSNDAVDASVDSSAAPYAVGDTLYLEDGKPFIIEHIGDLNVRLRDPSLSYPIARAESKESLARLLERYPQAAHSAPDTRESVQQPVRSETVAVYPAEENHLPYDVVVERMHFGEPEQVIAQTNHVPVPEIQPAAENFHITDEHLGEGGAKAKYGWNVDAIRTLQAIELEGRAATPDEQETLSHYVGWGGLPQAFDPDNQGWSKEYAELKDLLSDTEYASARASTLNAHYTSPTAIKAIYGAIERMGFTTGNVLEPACGVGNFLGLLPESMAGSNLYGVELDSMVTEYLTSLITEKEFSPATWNNRLAALKAFISYASACYPEYIALSSELGAIKAQKDDPFSKVEYMSEEAVRILLAEPDATTKLGLRDRVMLIFFYDTGARIQEILSVRICDLKMETTPKVILRGKGNKVRTVPLMKDTVQHLNRYIATFHEGEPATSTQFLFYTERRDVRKPICDDTVRLMMQKYANRAKTKSSEIPERVHPHLWRHTRAMHLYQHGMDLTLVAQWLGHTHLETTLIYAHADTEHKRKAITRALGDSAAPGIQPATCIVKDGELLKRLYGL